MEENPLHPFELHDIIQINLGGLDISINKAVIMMWVVVALITTLMMIAASSRSLVPGKIQLLAEMVVDFIRTMILDTMGKDGMKFFPLVATLFLFILFCNWLGLIPGTYTVTSQIVVTGVFAGAVYLLSLILGFALHGMKFLGILVPPGTPGWMLPLMVPIEVISQLARPVSLAVRLFANMTAGHLLLTIFAIMTNELLVVHNSGLFQIAFAPLPFAGLVAFTGFEILVAVLQAYIFTILTAVYIAESMHPGH